MLAAKARLRDEIWAAMSVEGHRPLPGAAQSHPELRRRRGGRGPARGTPTSGSAPARSRRIPIRRNSRYACVRSKTEAALHGGAAPRTNRIRSLCSIRRGSPIRPAGPQASRAPAGRRARVALDAMQPVDLVVDRLRSVSPRTARGSARAGDSATSSSRSRPPPDSSNARTIVATTVHEAQVRAAGEIPVTPHDLRVDVIADARTCDPGGAARPAEPAETRLVDLTEEKIASIPLLDELRARR